MPDIATVTLVTINPSDNVVTVRAKVSRDGDELAPNPIEVEVSFGYATMQTLNATQGATTLDGREWVRGAKKAAQKALRQYFNGRPGAIAAAIAGLDANG